MEKLTNIHPGEILLQEFLIPPGISVYRLAKEHFFLKRAFLKLSKEIEE
jgi:plasmid maintenance system antidote protein VapI